MARPDKRPAGGKRQNASLEASRRRTSALLKLMGIGAVAIAVIAFIFQASFGRTGGVSEIGLNETDTLKTIFFSGEPWLIQCIGPGLPLDSTFVAAAPHLAANVAPYSAVKTAALPCGDKLPSGKTVYERFKLNPSTKPLVALFANGERPQVVSKDALEMTATLVKRVSEASKLRLSDVSTPSSFGRACLSKVNKLCIMVFPYTGMSAQHNETLRAVAASYRTMQFAVIATENVEISIEKGLPAREETEAEYLRVAVSRIFPDNSAQALAYRGPFEETALKAWLAELASGETELNMLSKKPSASRRRRPRDPNEDEATRLERRRQRKAERKAAEEALKAASEEKLKTLTPEERLALEAENKARLIEWERKRREQMAAEEGSSSIFDEDEDEDEDYEEEEVEEVQEMEEEIGEADAADEGEEAGSE